MIEKNKLPPALKEAIFVTESECGKMSDEEIELCIMYDEGKITFEDVKKELLKKIGVVYRD